MANGHVCNSLGNANSPSKKKRVELGFEYTEGCFLFEHWTAGGSPLEDSHDMG